MFESQKCFNHYCGLFVVLFTAQLWRLNLTTNELANSYFSEWEFEDNSWKIPSEDKENYIEVTHGSDFGKVLAINGENIVLEDKAVNSKSSQLWMKGPENSKGYFWLKNKGNGKFLTLCIHTVKGEEKTPITSVKGTEIKMLIRI